MGIQHNAENKPEQFVSQEKGVRVAYVEGVGLICGMPVKKVSPCWVIASLWCLLGCMKMLRATRKLWMNKYFDCIFKYKAMSGFSISIVEFSSKGVGRQLMRNK